MDNNKLSKSNQSVEKALLILEILCQNTGEMRLQDIASQADLPASTALRMVNTLVRCGYAAQNPESLKYYPSYKLCTISSGISASNALVKVAKPFMDTLAREAFEAITFAIEYDGHAMFIAINQNYVHSVRVEHTVGILSPMHTSAVGKILLFNHTKSEIADIFNKSDKPVNTQNTITDIHSLFDNLSLVSKNGYSMNDEEGTIGAKCFACPVYDCTGVICSAIGISGPSVHVTEDYISKMLPLLRQTADSISRQLGYTGPANPALQLRD